MTYIPTSLATEQHARRAARRVGMRAVKSRWRRNTVDNHGGFQLINDQNRIVDGERFDMSAREVVDFCKQRA